MSPSTAPGTASGAAGSRTPPGSPGSAPPDPTAADRGQWGSTLGFLLAAVGSAVGLGNMWRFGAMTSSRGGAAFVLLYLLFTLVVGLPLLLAELSLGRRTRRSPPGALRAGLGRRWVPLAWLFLTAAFIIFSFYSVIAGWAVRYTLETALVGLPADPSTHFAGLASGPAAAAYHLVFVAVTASVVAAGVRGGIERTALILMPLLFLVLVVMALWAATLPGSGDGYAFYLDTDFRAILDAPTIASAAGQAYFSLSLGMGAIITFASYLDDRHDLPVEGGIIAAADFSMAFLAGLVIFPLVFAFGLSEAVVGLTADQAEGVLFIALPAAFATLGALGRAVGTLFFLALSVAALTSTISMLEVIVSSVVDETGLSRRKAAWGAGAGVALLGLLPAWSLGALGAMNTLAGDIFLGAGAFLLTVGVGWFMDDPMSELARGAPRWMARLLPGWRLTIRWIAPLVTGGVLLLMLAGSAGAQTSRRAPTGPDTIVVRPGDPRLDVERVVPHRATWRVTICDGDNCDRVQGLWTDTWAHGEEEGRPTMVFRQLFVDTLGSILVHTETAFDAATFRALRSRQELPGGVRVSYRFAGDSVSGTLRQTAGAEPRPFTLVFEELPWEPLTPVFNLFPFEDLEPGTVVRFPVWNQVAPGAAVTWTNVRVDSLVRVRNLDGSTLDAWHVTWTFDAQPGAVFRTLLRPEPPFGRRLRVERPGLTREWELMDWQAFVSARTETPEGMRGRCRTESAPGGEITFLSASSPPFPRAGPPDRTAGPFRIRRRPSPPRRCLCGRNAPRLPNGPDRWST